MESDKGGKLRWGTTRGQEGTQVSRKRKEQRTKDNIPRKKEHLLASMQRKERRTNKIPLREGRSNLMHVQGKNDRPRQQIPFFEKANSKVSLRRNDQRHAPPRPSPSGPKDQGMGQPAAMQQYRRQPAAMQQCRNAETQE